MKNISNKELHLDFPNAMNEPINGILRQHNTTAPLLIICHGYGSSKEHPSLKKISKSLFQLGHNTFIFNFSKNAQLTALENQIADIQTIINYFTTYKKIILLGGSLGALTAAIATPKYKKIKGLITVNGFFGKRYLGRKFLRIYVLFHISKIYSRQNKLLLQYMNKELHPEQIKIPVLVIHSLADKDVFIKQSQLFYKKLPGPKRFYEMDHADHDLLTKNSVEEVIKAIDDWLKTTTY